MGLVVLPVPTVLKIMATSFDSSSPNDKIKAIFLEQATCRQVKWAVKLANMPRIGIEVKR